MKKFDKQIALQILSYSVWFGLVTGLVEGVALYFFQRYGLLQGQITYLGSSLEVIWIAPIFDLLFFLGVGIFLSIAAQILPQTFAKRASLFLFCFLTVFAWIELYLSGRLSPVATGALAVGIAYQGSLMLYEREAKFSRLVHNTSKALAAIALLLVIVIQGGFWIQERIALRNLPPAQESTPNILVIVVDTLRADHLSLQGYERNTDPTLTRIAQEGVMFENAYATSSWTVTAHASLFTGRWPYEHGADGGKDLDDTYPTIAEALTARGYRTGAFIGNFETLKRQWGFGRGFMHFEDYYQSVSNLAVSSLYGRLIEYYGLHKVLGMQFKIDRRWAPEINESALQWIDQDPEHPFFVFINYFDVHAPYVSPERAKFSEMENPGGLVNTDWTTADIYNPKTPEQIQSEIDAYDGGIYYTDQQISLLLGELEARGVLENTIVVITSDHGELFGEHGLWEHHNSLYRPVIYVPLIVWYPKSVPPGARISTPVSNAALPATLLDMLGQPEQTEFPGPSLAQLWHDPASGENWPDPIAEMAQSSWVNPNHLSISGDMFSIISPEWQYIEHSKLGGELYNLADDPDQLNNLAALSENITVLEHLRNYYIDALDTLGLTWQGQNP